VGYNFEESACAFTFKKETTVTQNNNSVKNFLFIIINSKDQTKPTGYLILDPGYLILGSIV
jgi:hypothetical protein